MEKITDPMISEEGSVYSLAGLRRLLRELKTDEMPENKNNIEKGERLCG